MLTQPTIMEPQYRLQVSQEAIDNLHSLPADDQIRVEGILDQVAKNEKPTEHPKVQVLQNNQSEKLYKIRIGDHRAVARLEKPMLQILRFDKRENVYDGINKLYDAL